MSTDPPLARLHEPREDSAMPLPTPRARWLRAARIPALVAAAWAGGCAPPLRSALAPLCADQGALAHVEFSVDSVRPTAGPALVAARGSRFRLVITFAAPTSAQPDGATRGATPPAGCSDRSGTATAEGELPAGLRNATSSTHDASWRIERDSVILDLNPRARDNNVFVVLPLEAGRGHWGLSTFAGQVASGSTAETR